MVAPRPEGRDAAMPAGEVPRQSVREVSMSDDETPSSGEIGNVNPGKRGRGGGPSKDSSKSDPSKDGKGSRKDGKDK